MNKNHAKLMPSPEWAAHIQGEVLPSATAGVDLGADLLELGPGPGAATDWLRRRVRRLVAVEQEEEAAARLEARFEGTNVEVVHGDAAALGYPDGSFDTVAAWPATGCTPSTRATPTTRSSRPGSSPGCRPSVSPRSPCGWGTT